MIMKDESKPNNISRRKFIKNTGTGLLGSYLIAPTISGKDQRQLKSNRVSQQLKQVEKRKTALSLIVNGKKINTKVFPETTLAELLRNELNLTGTKISCNQGECGACTVLLNKKAVYSCHMLALDAADKEVITIEGLLSGEKLHPIQESFVKKDGMQCGFCTPGQVMAAYALLLSNPKPNKNEIMDSMSGNICRCAAYPKIIESVQEAADSLKY
jgi:aerobic-type carbon monoxide dehydrogenase small subunit (CoxS/CutS family)